MRKNGSRLISVKQYRATDLFIFALILTVSEVLTFQARKWFPGVATFTFSLLVPIVLTVMMRWGWPGVLYAAAAGLVDGLMNIGNATGAQFAIYIIGNAFIGLMLIPLIFIGKDRIRKRWWASALFTVGGWASIYLGRSVIWAIAFAISPVGGAYAWTGFIAYLQSDLLSLAMAVVVAVSYTHLTLPTT